MEIHQLEYVVAVANHRQFTKAAEEICLSQSSLSQQIIKLEEELEVRLFDRTTRSVRLTPAGKEFLLYAKRILSEVKQARKTMLQYTDLERGHIVLGTLPIIGQLGFTSLIASFQRKYPGINIEIREGGSEDLLEWLLLAEIEVALLTPPDRLKSEENLEFHLLLEDEIVLITSLSHRLANSDKINLADAATENFLFMNYHSGMRKISKLACNLAGFEPKIIYESSQVETICGLVEENIGVALLTSRVAASYKHYKIHVVHLNRAYMRKTALALPKTQFISKAVDAFRDFTLDWIPNIKN
ncbi:hypothetical protein ABE41_018140 [Fictibacillus arsenicus]|uniref:HTH lysR-type domain-containing protein n=1 Tax=Fictibacillus arsenicus TaxID=255247 RepID=A0A1B1Z926_9BACL|nr:LysR family transcriptional regulator [Fictibacillus arsenicus]ANX13936.1 hypothetical protein ABE41_018140 [Fictibacillus arsenicus]